MNRAECLTAGSQQTGGYPGISLQGDRSHLGREMGVLWPYGPHHNDGQRCEPRYCFVILERRCESPARRRRQLEGRGELGPWFESAA